MASISHEHLDVQPPALNVIPPTPLAATQSFSAQQATKRRLARPDQAQLSRDNVLRHALTSGTLDRPLQQSSVASDDIFVDYRSHRSREIAPLRRRRASLGSERLTTSPPHSGPSSLRPTTPHPVEPLSQLRPEVKALTSKAAGVVCSVCLGAHRTKTCTAELIFRTLIKVQSRYIAGEPGDVHLVWKADSSKLCFQYSIGSACKSGCKYLHTDDLHATLLGATCIRLHTWRQRIPFPSLVTPPAPQLSLMGQLNQSFRYRTFL